MHQRPKIHVFLGAPLPSSAPTSEPEAWVGAEGRPAADWRHLELTWREGRLIPAADEALDVVDEAREKRLHVQEADWNEESERGRAGKVPPEKTGVSREEASDTDEEEPCSASVHEYLDRCFPAAQPEPEPEPEPEPGGSEQQRAPAPPPLSARTHYLSTWTLSQALILRGRHGVQSAASPEKTPPKHTQTPPSASSSTPELFSPTTPSPGASAELFSPPCPTPRAEEGGVVLQATTDGVLCSQESTTDHDTPTKPPSSKRVRLSESGPAEPGSTRTPGPGSTTTLLSGCNKAGQRCSVLVVVVHPCHLKEVKAKLGRSAGTFIPLASIVVTDQSAAEMKVVLWRRAAFWALTVIPGEILLITGLQVNEDRWRGETVLQSSFSSKLLNLGHASTSPPVTQHADARSLSVLSEFIRRRRPLLVSVPPRRPPQDLNRLPYAALRTLQVNTLVHALLRVTHTHISSEWRSEAASLCRSAVQLKAVLTVEQPDGQQGALLLWGAAVDWLPRFNRDRATVWDFHLLLVREGLTSDLPELHSTPWSSVRALDPTDRRGLDFTETRRRQQDGGRPVELDVDTLLSQKYSGEVELSVQVFAFHFQQAPPSQTPAPVLDSATPLDAVMAALSGDVAYTGCGRCGAELDTDANGIYGPCYPCLPHTAVRRYYRPGVLTVRGRGHSSLSVQVPPVPLQKILDAPPDRLQRSSAPGSEVKLLQVAAERLQKLLSLPRKTVVITVRSNFLCDENSVPISQDFTLRDLGFPG